MSNEELKGYWKFKEEVQDLVGDPSLLEIISENDYARFFQGYLKELENGKKKFIKSCVRLFIS